MDLFMPAERVLYNRSYYFSDEAVDDYNEYIADRDGVNIDVVSSLDFFMNEVWKEIDYAIDNDLSDEISCFDRMLRDLKCGGDPEHPTEISVVGPRVRHHARWRANIGQHGRRARRAALLFRRRAEARARILQGAPFENPPHRLPGDRRVLHGQPGRGPPPACIARRDQPGRPLRIARKRAPFLPWRRAEAGAGVLQAGEG